MLKLIASFAVRAFGFRSFRALLVSLAFIHFSASVRNERGRPRRHAPDQKGERVRLVAEVVPERELSQIQRQVVGADIVEGY